MKKFELIPIILGQTDAAQVARAMSDNLDDKTLVVASLDLSHQKPYEAAKDPDQRCAKAICNLVQKGWKPELLDYRNNGDTAGDKSGVVGYAAIAFFGAEPQNFTRAERKQLLALARETVQEVTISGSLPKREGGAFPKKFTEPRGCFVTLTKGGDLRGCIGHIMPQEALYHAVMDNARSAAQRDPRFPAVRTDELDKLEVEVSVLTEPKPLEFSSPEDLLTKLRPYRDGVVLKIGRNGATYLPQVWSQLPDKVDFLNNLSQKAGCAATAWRDPGTAVLIYEVEAFKESEIAGGSANPST